MLVYPDEYGWTNYPPEWGNFTGEPPELTMPDVGTTKKGRELDRRPRGHDFVWVKCPVCGYERWVARYYLVSQEVAGRCRSCDAVNPITGHGWAWKGGSYNRPDGYVNVRLEKESPFYAMTDMHGQVLEHRLVMARYIGRCVEPYEVVHHENGIKDDNRIENLELLPGITYHLVDVNAKRYIKYLERKVKQLENKILAMDAEPDE